MDCCTKKANKTDVSSTNDIKNNDDSKELISNNDAIKTMVCNGKTLNMIPVNATNLILILGQCSNEDGSAHQYLIDRSNNAYQYIVEQKLDMDCTYVIPSGSDVSQTLYKRKYGKDPDSPHRTEAELIKELLLQKENCVLKSKNIVLEPNALTTIENFVFLFKMIHLSKIKALKGLTVITSDFHVKRSEFYFNILYNNDDTKWIEIDDINFISVTSNCDDKTIKLNEYYIKSTRNMALKAAKDLWIWKNKN